LAETSVVKSRPSVPHGANLYYRHNLPMTLSILMPDYLDILFIFGNFCC